MGLGMMDDTQKGRQTKGKFKIPRDHPQLYRQMKISTLGHKETLIETRTQKDIQVFNKLYRRCPSQRIKNKKSKIKIHLSWEHEGKQQHWFPIYQKLNKKTDRHHSLM